MKRAVAVLVMGVMVIGFAVCATWSQTGAVVGAGSLGLSLVQR